MSANSPSSEKEERPIYVWPKGADLSNLKRAVLELELPFRVRPFWYEVGKHDRVIALEPGLDAMVDHVHPRSPETVKMAVEWFFQLRELPNVHTVEKKMAAVFGEGTREIYPEDPWEKPNSAVVGEDGKWVWP